MATGFFHGVSKAMAKVVRLCCVLSIMIYEASSAKLIYIFYKLGGLIHIWHVWKGSAFACFFFLANSDGNGRVDTCPQKRYL